jgi:hypothetical protein
LATDLGGRSNWAQNGADDFRGKSGSVGLQFRQGLLLIFFDTGACLLDLVLRSGASVMNSLSAQLAGVLAAGFLELENFLPSIAEALLVVGGSGFRSGDVGTCFFHRSLGAAAAFGEHSG